MKAVGDGLRRLDGVRDVKIDLQANLVTIIPDPYEELDLAAVPKRIRETGFTPGEMRLSARGEVERAGTGLRFRIRNWRRALPVVGVNPRATRVEGVRVEYEDGPIRLVAE